MNLIPPSRFVPYLAGGAGAESHGVPYGFEQHLPGTTFDAAGGRITGALQTEGFGVLTKIDVRDTLKKKLDVDIRPYVILGACNPSLAHQALSAEAQIGLLLPCNIVVREDPAGAAIVSIANPRAMFAVVDNPGLMPVVDEADRRLRKVMQDLADLALHRHTDGNHLISRA